ncbi:MAG TPA: hypothetical protein VGL94_22370 [Ktedonobacteraceae bacterium]
MIENPWKRTVPPEPQISEAGPPENNPAAEEHPWYLPEQKEESASAEGKSEPEAA